MPGRVHLAWARARGNVEFVAQLAAAGPPPYANLLDYPMVFAHEQQVYGTTTPPTRKAPAR